MSFYNLPVNLDPVSSFLSSAASLGTPGVTGFTGVLDANGRATAQLDWSLLPFLLASVAGENLTFAAWTSEGSLVSVSNPSDVIVD